MQQDIQQIDQAVDQLITKLAELLEQANGVLADINRARRAERPEQTPPAPQPQEDAPRDEPTVLQDVPPPLDETQQPEPSPDDPTAQHGTGRGWWSEEDWIVWREREDAGKLQ